MWISNRMAKRKRNGKESEVFIDGIQLPPVKIAKSKYREGYVPMMVQHGKDHLWVHLNVKLNNT